VYKNAKPLTETVSRTTTATGKSSRRRQLAEFTTVRAAATTRQRRFTRRLPTAKQLPKVFKYQRRDWDSDVVQQRWQDIDSTQLSDQLDQFPDWFKRSSLVPDRFA